MEQKDFSAFGASGPGTALTAYLQNTLGSSGQRQREGEKTLHPLAAVQLCAPRIYNLTLCGACYSFFRNVPHSPWYVLNGHETEQSEGQGNLHSMGSQKVGHDLVRE